MECNVKIFGDTPEPKKLIEAIKNKEFIKNSDDQTKLHLNKFYEYNLSQNNALPTTILANDLYTNTDSENTYSIIDEETLLMLQDTLLFHNSGGVGTKYNLNNSFKVNEHSLCIKDQIKPKIQDEDIFVGVGELENNFEERKFRASSLERSVTPEIEEFIDEIYNIKKDDSLSKYNIDNLYEQNDSDHQIYNEILSESKEILFDSFNSSNKNSKNVLNKKDIFSRLEDSIPSYAECYLEVDGISLYETCHEEIDIKNKTRKFQHLNEDNHKKKHLKKRNKSTNQEWKAIQKIINSSDFKSLDTFNSNLK